MVFEEKTGFVLKPIISWTLRVQECYQSYTHELVPQQIRRKLYIYSAVLFRKLASPSVRWVNATHCIPLIMDLLNSK